MLSPTDCGPFREGVDGDSNILTHTDTILTSAMQSMVAQNNVDDCFSTTALDGEKRHSSDRVLVGGTAFQVSEVPG